MKKRMVAIVSVVVLCLIMLQSSSFVVEADTMYDSPYISLAPDGNAFTTCAGDRSYSHYELGTTVTTGLNSSLWTPGTGEHQYTYSRSGQIPVGKWVVSNPNSTCLRNMVSVTSYHGLTFRTTRCGQKYNSGWWCYCADCEEVIVPMHVYMSKAAAQSLKYFEVNSGKEYYFLCPHCTNLEMGALPPAHTCKGVSWNKYKVKYEVNTSADATGEMDDSTHYYNNSTSYNGQEVTPVTTLSLNKYEREGYAFIGWNAAADGSGKWYEDGAEIYNLTDKEGGIVTLYAQWKVAESTLQIDPNGGTYGGTSDVTSITQKYGSEYEIADTLNPPAGYTLNLETNGGETIASITQNMSFTEWLKIGEFKGILNDNTYFFMAPDGHIDTLKAQYEYEEIVLPTATKIGNSFLGWYYDESLSSFAGMGGDSIMLTQDTTLYAKWKVEVYTEQMKIDLGDNVYPQGTENTYYVRSDGVTPVMLSFKGYISGATTDFYQLTHSVFETQMDGTIYGRNVLITPMHPVQSGSIETSGSNLAYSGEGQSVLTWGYDSKTIRSDENRTLEAKGQFLVSTDTNGKTIRVTPVAGAVSDTYSVYSDKNADLQNSIYLIGDGLAPVVYGLDELREIDLIDRDEQEDTVVTLTSTDTGSGIRSFYAVVTNSDNGLSETYVSEDNYSIAIDILVDSPLYYGDVGIEIHAIDNVGNERIESHDFLEFTLSAYIEKILPPHGTEFKCGESGILYIKTTGYVERVEVIFPREMLELNSTLNKTYVYQVPEQVKEEQLQFMVPLYTPDSSDYEIVVRAYRDGRGLEAYPDICVVGVNGTVLDEFRTRLR